MQNQDAVFMRAFVADPTPRPMRSNQLLEVLNAEVLAWEEEARRITMRFSPPAAFRQGAGLIQGGIIGTMLDFAMVLPAFTACPEGDGLSTTSMTTHFYGPGSATQFVAIGQVNKAGRRMIFTSARLKDGERDIAAATSSLMVLPGVDQPD